MHNIIALKKRLYFNRVFSLKKNTELRSAFRRQRSKMSHKTLK